MTELTIPRYAPLWPTILDFNGTSDYVEILNSQDINFCNQDFTVACWVLAAQEQQDTSSDQNDIVSKFLGATKGYPYAIRYLNQNAGENAGKIIALRSDGRFDSSVISETTIDDGQFHYIAFVRETEGDSATLKLYVDGEESVTAEDTTNPEFTINDSLLYLGKRGDSNIADDKQMYFTGGIGRLLIFKEALDQTQIQYWMNQNSSILPKDNLAWVENLIGDWRCDEGYGAIAFDYANSNNGILGGSKGLEARPKWVASTIPMFVDFVKDPKIPKESDTEQTLAKNIPPNLAIFLAQ